MERLTPPPRLLPSAVANVGGSTDPTKAGCSLFENASHFERSVVGVPDGARHTRPERLRPPHLTEAAAKKVLAEVVGLGGDDVERRASVELLRGPVTTGDLRRALPGERLTVDTLAKVAAIANTVAVLVDDWPGVDVIELNPLRIVEGEPLVLDALAGMEGSTAP